MLTTSRTGTHTQDHQICPSTPIDPHARSLSTQRRRNNPRRWHIPCNRQSNSPTRSSTATRLRTSRLALANEYPAQLPRCLSSVNAGSAVAHAANGPRTALPWPCKPLHTSQSSPGAYAWYCASAIGNAHTPAPGANANTNGHRYFALMTH